jgi:hypothetical protein
MALGHVKLLVFVIFDTIAVFVFCPAVLFSIKAAWFHTDRISSRIPRRHVRPGRSLAVEWGAEGDRGLAPGSWTPGGSRLPRAASRAVRSGHLLAVDSDRCLPDGSYLHVHPNRLPELRPRRRHYRITSARADLLGIVNEPRSGWRKLRLERQDAPIWMASLRLRRISSD